jgi:competence protein ComEC
LYRIGNAELRVLHPARTFRSHEKKTYAAENDRSLVVQIRALNRVFLFTGDIGAEAEQSLLRDRRDLKCDLLKMPHHGSRSSSSESFVTAAAPAMAIATAGAGNRYHHPCPEVLDRYERVGTHIYRTDRDGAVIFTADAASIQATVWNDLRLRQIAFTPGRTFKEELRNWKRLGLRRWEL